MRVTLNPKLIVSTLILALGLMAGAFWITSYFRYTSEGAVWSYLKKNPGETAIACFDPTQPEAGFYRNENEAFPLASTYKIILLAAYAEEVAAGRLDPQEIIPISELERYYLPGTDGGAHDEFIRAQGAGLTSLKLDQVVAGMVSYSSNANTDYLLSRLSAVDFPQLYQRLGLNQTSQPFSFLGLYLFIKNHETGTYAEEELTPAEVQAEQARLERLFVNDPAWRAAEVSFISKPTNAAPVYIQKQVLNLLGMRGSAHDLGQILLAAYGYTPVFPAEVQNLIREKLEWPKQMHPENQETYKVLAANSGVWPGSLTSTWYAQTLQGKPQVLVVLYRNLPNDFWDTWITTFTHQKFETQILASGECSTFSEALK